MRVPCEVPQQERLMIRPLDDQAETLALRERLRCLEAARVIHLPIVVQKKKSPDEAVRGWALTLTRFDEPNCLADQFKRVTGARCQLIPLNVQGKASLLGETLQQCGVAIFALALAANEDPPTQRSERARPPSHHPSWGIAPKAPSIYFR